MLVSRCTRRASLRTYEHLCLLGSGVELCRRKMALLRETVLASRRCPIRKGERSAIRGFDQSRNALQQGHWSARMWTVDCIAERAESREVSAGGLVCDHGD